MDKWIRILAVSAVFLISALLVRSNRPTICINSSIVQDIVIAGEGQLKNCANPDHAIESFKFGSQSLDFWDYKAMAKSFEPLRYLPLTPLKRVSLFAGKGPSYKNHGSVWEFPAEKYQDINWLMTSLVEYWSESSAIHLDIHKRLIYAELVSHIFLGLPAAYSSNWSSWGTQSYSFKSYCEEDQVSLRLQAFCKSYAQSKGEYFIDQAWGVQFFVSHLVLEYYGYLDDQQQSKFKYQVLALAQNKSYIKSGLKFNNEDSLLIKKEKFRTYIVSIFKALNVAPNNKNLHKVLARSYLTNEVISITEK